MKIDYETFYSVGLALLIAGVILIILNGLIGGYFASIGAELVHGKDTTGKTA